MESADSQSLFDQQIMQPHQYSLKNAHTQAHGDMELSQHLYTRVFHFTLTSLTFFLSVGLSLCFFFFIALLGG